MARVEATLEVPVDQWTAFAVSQTTGDVRKRWDNFIREQHHLDGASEAGRGVRTETTSKHGLTMVSEYVSFAPPDRVGMKMLTGPWFFAKFGGGWSFRPVEGRPDHTHATWRYTFEVKPAWLQMVADPVGNRLLGWDIERRLAGFGRGCTDPVVLEAAADLVTRWQ